VTHLHEEVLRPHIANALEYGASAEEILEAFRLTSVLGIHTMVTSLPLLLDVLDKHGAPVDVNDLSPQQRAVREGYLEARGFWNPAWDGMLKLAPDFTEGHIKMGDATRAAGPLEPKVKEFIWIAVDSSTTHLFESGVRNHMTAALKFGATVEEIVEVLELTCDLGVQSVTFGISILLEEMAQTWCKARSDRTVCLACRLSRRTIDRALCTVTGYSAPLLTSGR
jgi:alkylhydroperoxidase/carboxymuconolactone decarboxylase family protein YurZ